MYAVIQTGGKQYLVTPGEEIKIEKLPKMEEGKKVTFKEVLLTFDPQEEEIKIGTPFLKGAQVKGEVTEVGRGEKITIFKYRSKKRQHTKKGHRQSFCQVKISEIKS
jgi:large subunit ribosomal protein L21